MALWGRRVEGAPEPFDATWRRGPHEAAWDPVIRRRGRQEPGVRVAAFGHDVQFWGAELLELLDGSIRIAESRGDDPLVYLCTPDAPARGSSAAASMGSVPQGSLVLLSESEAEEPIVLHPDEARSFEAWVRQLPGG